MIRACTPISIIEWWIAFKLKSERPPFFTNGSNSLSLDDDKLLQNWEHQVKGSSFADLWGAVERRYLLSEHFRTVPGSLPKPAIISSSVSENSPKYLIGSTFPLVDTNQTPQRLHRRYHLILKTPWSQADMDSKIQSRLWKARSCVVIDNFHGRKTVLRSWIS